MAIFGKYTEFYDTLYQDKNYKRECNFLEKIFRKYSNRKVKTILDLGCGTISHDIILAKMGYKVTGVDRSGEMLKIAKEKTKKEKLKIHLHKGNIQTIRLGKRFDAVISMFDVMGYQTTDKAFKKALCTVRRHLKKDGLFIFDCWHGPAVLKDKPKNKIKVIHNAEEGKISRYSKCKVDISKQIVDIGFVTKKYFKKRLITTNREYHKMRFFFLSELKVLLDKVRFNIKKISPFLKLSKKVTENDWKIVIICEKNPL